jgi:cardiolipin synthase
MHTNDWTTGNTFRLLENGEEFFPRLTAAIDRADREILVRTFIWLEDEVGRQVAQSLVRAARRGVEISVTVDGFGSPEFSDQFLKDMRECGIRFLVFDPQPTWLHFHTNVFCRLHDKITIVDRRVAFVGGINICEHHLWRYGDRSLQDYAVEIEGPVVEKIHEVNQRRESDRGRLPIRRLRRRLRRLPREIEQGSGDGQAMFVIRDNADHPSDIESMYRIGFRAARREIVIANAYFFPSHRFIRDLVSAARRGVAVKLILQGNPDVPISVAAASLLYEYLLSHGVRIYRYMARPLHAKVAVIDGIWATVGSSNLDPTSLGFNLEANVFALDRSLAHEIERSLGQLLETACRPVPSGRSSATGFWNRWLPKILFHLTYRMPRWGRTVLRRGQHTVALRPSRMED